ncbi:uncharacterized protein LOC143532640 [Bidens hawaiensis]|uniref:uncharacterized protein LOC143532640 n=1 Tax=Bidens hawaiensis TaxID=980011 RepID=UPI00404AB6B3
MRITKDLECEFDYFKQKTDDQGTLGFTEIQRNGPTIQPYDDFNTHEVAKKRTNNAIASYDLWIWSAFFFVAGSNNDINVLKQLPVLEGYISNTIHVASLFANDNYYRHGYYLGDGIYPEYAIIVKTFRDLINEKRDYFKKVQEFRERTSRGVLGFFTNVGILLKIHVVYGHLK